MFRKALLFAVIVAAVATVANASPSPETGHGLKPSIVIDTDLKVGAAISPGGRSVIQPEDWSASAR